MTPPPEKGKGERRPSKRPRSGAGGRSEKPSSSSAGGGAPKKSAPKKSAPKRSARPIQLPLVGWREWVAFPGLGIERIKAKVDTGARTSSLHAYDMRRFRRGGRSMVRFKVHPIQRDARTTVEAEAILVGDRLVRSSTGVETVRPVILTELELLGKRWPIEITLIRRDAMGFRLLLGRQALRGRCVIDPARSFIDGVATTPLDRSSA